MLRPSSKVIHALICIFISLIVLVNYSNSLRLPFILDDSLLVMKNYLIRDIRFIPQIFQTDLTLGVKSEANFYRPLQTLSYLFDFRIWRLNPLGYHITSVMFFIINCLLVYCLIFLISRNFLVSAFSSFMFASHPIYCEAVTYISGRAEVLMGIFLILSLIAFIRYTDFQGKVRAGLYSVSVFSFILGLLSKELALVFPLALVLYDYCFRPDGLSRLKPFLKRYLPFIIVAAVYIGLRLTLLKFSDKLPATANFSIYKRILFSLANFNLYFGMLLYPFGLHMSRTFLTPLNFRDSYAICGVVSLGIIFSWLWWSVKKSRWLFFWGGWFFLWLIPQSGIFPINSFLAEHFIYLSAIGFFVLTATAMVKFLPRAVAVFLLVIVVSIFSYATIIHNRDWRNEEVFYKRILQYSPKSWLAHVNLGNFYLNQRLFDRAENEYLEALKLQPTLLVAHSNLALVYLNKDLQIKAIREIGRGLGQENILVSSRGIRFPPLKAYLKVMRKNRDLANIYNGLGMLWVNYKLYDLARLAFEETLKLAPDYADAHWNMGLYYWEMKRYDLARKEWELTLRLDPANAYVRQWLARLDSDK